MGFLLYLCPFCWYVPLVTRLPVFRVTVTRQILPIQVQLQIPLLPGSLPSSPTWNYTYLFSYLFLPGLAAHMCILKKVSVPQLCPTLCNPMDCSLPGSSVHGILQAGILEWIAMPSSRESSQPKDWTWVSCIAGRLFTILSHQGRHMRFTGQVVHRDPPTVLNDNVSGTWSSRCSSALGSLTFFYTSPGLSNHWA